MTAPGHFMVLSYERTFEDWKAYNVTIFHRMRSLGRAHSHVRLRLAGLAIASLIFACVYFLVLREPVATGAFFSVAAFLALTAVTYDAEKAFLAALKRSNDAGEWDGILGHWTLSFTDDGIVSKSDLMELAVKWSAVRDVHGSPDHIFIYFRRSLGEVIPRRVFASRDEEQRLVAFLSAKTGKQLA